MTRQKRPSRNQESDTSSVSSDSSHDSLVSNSVEEIVDVEHVLDENLDLLTEKRTPIREAAWQKVNKIFKMNYLEEAMERRKDTVIDLAIRAIRKGNETETALAASCAGILAITLGPSTQSYVDTMRPVFQEIVNDKAKPSSLRVDITRVAAVIIFVCSSEPTDTTEWLGHFAGLFRDDDAAVREAALDAWCLLASSLSDNQVVSDLLPSVITGLVQIVDDNDVDVKMAAGRTLALLIEASKNLKEATEEDFDIDVLNEFIDVEELFAIFENLSDSYTKFQSKRERQKQRNVFRDIVKFVSDWDAPSEVLLIKHQKFAFEGWAKLVQLNAFRDLLGAGFQTHFEQNTVLGDILSVEVNIQASKKKLSAVEKRMFQSPNSAQAKAQTRLLAKGRAQRRAAIHGGQD